MFFCHFCYSHSERFCGMVLGKVIVDALAAGWGEPFPTCALFLVCGSFLQQFEWAYISFWPKKTGRPATSFLRALL